MSLMFDKSKGFFTEKETGKAGLSLRQLANLTGVSHTALNSWIEKIVAKTPRMPKYFQEFVENPEKIYFDSDQQWRQGQAMIISSDLASEVLSYYTDSKPGGAGKRCTEQAIETVRRTNKLGLDAYIYDMTGYQKFRGDRTAIIQLDDHRAVTEQRLAALEEDIKLYEHHLMREKEATQYYSNQVDVQLELKEGWREKYDVIYAEYRRLIKQMREERLRLTDHAEKECEQMDSTWVQIYFGDMIRKLMCDIKLHKIFHEKLIETIQEMEVITRMTAEQWENFIVIDHNNPVASTMMMEAFPKDIRRLVALAHLGEKLLPELSTEAKESGMNLEDYYEPYYQRGEKEKVEVLNQAFEAINYATRGFIDEKDFFSYYCGVETDEEKEIFMERIQTELESWKEKEIEHQEDIAFEDSCGDVVYTKTEILLMTDEERIEIVEDREYFEGWEDGKFSGTLERPKIYLDQRN
jgi:hypothetical protein